MLSRRNVIIFAAASVAWPAVTQGVLAQGVLAQDAPLPVLASFSILGDLARSIGGARVAVTELIGPDQDAHGFEPGPGAAQNVARAKVILVNGLGFEPWVNRLLKAAGASVKPTVLSAGIKPLAKPARPAAGQHGHAHEHAGQDPHAWHLVAHVKSYVAAIAAAFVAADPAGKALYEANTQEYLKRLDALAAEIDAAMAVVPKERRVLVTTHNAFRYLGLGLGLATHALQGVSAENEPSAADMAAIIRQLKQIKAPAVFLENVSDPRKLEQIARESGARVGGTLYSDALSLANGPAPTYIDMMRHNVRQIAEALKP